MMNQPQGEESQGRTLTDRYQIIQQLGEGGAGSVYKAWDQKLKRYVALKFLLPEGQRETNAPGVDLAAEAAALSSLQHPHVVGIFDFDTDGAEPFVVMEYLNGETVDQTIRRGALMEEDFAKMAQETLDGLAAAHKAGLAHRDIKPGNIMFHWLEGDSGFILKLLDFGLANQGARLSQQATGAGGTVAGSVHFMAPEQFLHQPIDFRADLYSLGCVFYYALTASYPCNGATVEEVSRAHLAHQMMPLGELRPDLSPLLADWVMWLMSRQPEERPEHAAEALRVFRGIRDGSLTALPGRRMLKTHTLPKPGTGGTPLQNAAGPTAVIEAPLGRDASLRMESARSSNTASQPVASHTGARRLTTGLAMPAAAAAAPAKAESAPSSRMPLFAGLGLLAAAGIGWALMSGGSKEKAAGGSAAAESAGSVAGPPSEGLVIWLDAAEGTMIDEGKRPGTKGSPISHWEDRAAAGGRNPAQYHRSRAQDDEKASRWPLLEDATGDGLSGKHPMLNFSGEKALIAGRDSTLVGDRTAEVFASDGRSWFALIDPSRSKTTEQPIIDGNHRDQKRAWGTWIRKGNLVSGGYREKESQMTSLPLPPSGYLITGGIWDGKTGQLQSFILTPDGKVTASPAITASLDRGDLESIRLGNSKGSPNTPGAEYLDGTLGTVLLYNRALSSAERTDLFRYLAGRYFGTALKP